MVKFTPDPERPVVMSDEEKRRLASMSEAQIEANAAADPDSRPLTDEAWERGRTRRLARKARELGLTTRPWVKTSFSPGSRGTEHVEADPRRRAHQPRGG